MAKVIFRKLRAASFTVLGVACTVLVLDFIVSIIYIPAGPPKPSYEIRTQHPVYHHDLRPNKQIIDYWGPIPHEVCTDANGFKSPCGDSPNKDLRHYDVAFIGDSFTEGVGLEYEKTFVGLFAQAHPELRVANLGVVSYNCSIYFKKLEYLLKQGYLFEKVVVLPDISDIQDESFYTLDSNNQIIDLRGPDKEDEGGWEAFRRKFYYTRAALRALRAEIKELRAGDDAEYAHIFLNRSAWTYDFSAEKYGKDGVPSAIAKALESMLKLKNLLDEYGIPLVVVVYPWPAQLYKDKVNHLGSAIWKNFCEENDCRQFVDANPFFFSEKDTYGTDEVYRRYYIPGDFHFNEMGNRALFEIIENSIQL